MRDSYQKTELNKISLGIIGGGIAGCTTALLAADEGMFVELFESTHGVLNESSDATPCRLGLGFHYMDLDTAILNLESSIQLVRYLKLKANDTFQVKFNPIEKDNLVNSGRIFYVIHNNSLVNKEEVLEIFNALKSHYIKLIVDDKKNEVFGKSENFFKEVDKREFSNVIDVSTVQTVIETCETLFDWPRFKNYLIDRLHAHPKIKIHLDTEIISIKRGHNLTMKIETGKNLHSELFDIIINSSWRNVDHLNGSMGYFNEKQTINRLKCMAIINSPPELLNTSMLIGYGDFCSLSSRPDGKGYLTYEPITNIEQFLSLKEKKKLDNYLTNLSENKKNELGEKIIQEASRYIIGGLEKNQLCGLRIGVVRTDKGKIDIKSKGQHFTRTFKGVDPITVGVIVNEARKHTYWCTNAHRVLELIKTQQELKHFIFLILSSIIKSASEKKISNFFPKLISDVIAFYLLNSFTDEKSLTYLKDNWEKEAKNYVTLFSKKHSVNEEIKINFPCLKATNC